MKRTATTLLAGLFILLAAPELALSKDKAEKSPEDTAADAYFKLRDEKDPTITAERIQRVITLGLDYLTSHPGHGRVQNVINSLSGYAGTMKDKKLAQMKEYCTSRLKYEIVSRRSGPGASDDVRLVLASLAAAVAGAEAKERWNRDNVVEYRAKIDALAEMKGSGRFLVGHEREFLAKVLETNPAVGEAHARKLAGHADKKVASMAEAELRLLGARKNPIELTFTTFDGVPFDLSATRGKTVLMLFWQVGHEKAADDVAEIRKIQTIFKKRGIEVVAICCDKADDRDAVEKFLKSRKVVWPVHFDGKGRDNDVAVALNVRSFPSVHIFDTNGLLTHANVKVNRVDAELRKIYDIK